MTEKPRSVNEASTALAERGENLPAAFDITEKSIEYQSWQKKGLLSFWNMGRILDEGKKALDHGGYTEFLDNVGISQPTAWRYMTLFNRVPENQILSLGGSKMKDVLELTSGPLAKTRSELSAMKPDELMEYIERQTDELKAAAQREDAGREQLEKLESDNEHYCDEIKALKKTKFDSSKHATTLELARIASEIERLSVFVSNPKNLKGDAAESILEHVRILNTKIGKITKACSPAAKK